MKCFNYQLVSLHALTKQHLQIILAPKDNPMPYQAGQYITIEYPNHFHLPFSIANTPREDHKIELHVRVRPDDKETALFIEVLKEREALTIAGPYGDCLYNEGTEPILIIAAGTGFAPAKALIEKMLELKSKQIYHLYWTAKQLEDFYLGELPLAWQKISPNFTFIPICTTERSNLFELIKQRSSMANTTVYVFGPPNLAMDALKELIPWGLKKENFHTDVLSTDQVVGAFYEG